MKKLIYTFSLFLMLGLYAQAQIPNGYYDGTAGLYGEELKSVLHDIIDDHDEPSYSDLRDYILPASDEDPQNPDNVILLYTGRSQAKNTFGGGVNEWNREHVWAKSHGDFGNDPPCGTDAHMIRPTDVSVNADRGNKDFDEGGQQHSEAPGCYYTEYTWEPRDEVKGDVARMILYMDVRYEGDNGELDLTAVDWVNTSPAPEHGRLSTLLEWHEQDPPDDFEINRNNVVYSYQENRNPFIDHPEFVDNIWGSTASISNPENIIDAGIFPNPVENIMYVRVDGEEGKLLLEIYSTSGKLMVEESINARGISKVNCDQLSSGLYLVRLFNEHRGDSYVSKITKK